MGVWGARGPETWSKWPIIHWANQGRSQEYDGRDVVLGAEPPGRRLGGHHPAEPCDPERKSGGSGGGENEATMKPDT